MKTSEAVSEISKAFCQMQSALKPAIKDSMNPAFKSKYATLAAVWEAAKDPLTANGMFVTQDLTTQEKSVSVTTRVMHVSGQWFEFGPFVVPVEKANAHGVGSAGSYAKRYSLSAALGVVAEDDDDGVAAVASTQTKSQAVAAKIPPAKEWHPVDGPPPPSDEERPPDNDDSVRFYQADGSHVDVPTVQFGKNKGTPINELSDKSLQWYLDVARENVADPSKAKWKAKESVWLNSLTREQDRRAGK